MEKKLDISDEQLKIYLRKQLSVNDLEKLLQKNKKIFNNPKEGDYLRTMAKMEMDQLEQELRGRIMLEDMKTKILARANIPQVNSSSGTKALRAKDMSMFNRVKRFFHFK